jgi:hypothetical protein
MVGKLGPTGVLITWNSFVFTVSLEVGFQPQLPLAAQETEEKSIEGAKYISSWIVFMYNFRSSPFLDQSFFKTINCSWET